MKQRVFVTGATGGMGFASLKEILKYSEKQDIAILARDSEKNRNILKSYMETPGLEIVWGDLNNYDDVLKCVKGCDLILHIAAFVSPPQTSTRSRLHAEYNQRDLRVWTAGAHPPRLHRHSCRNGRQNAACTLGQGRRSDKA